MSETSCTGERKCVWGDRIQLESQTCRDGSPVMLDPKSKPTSILNICEAAPLLRLPLRTMDATVSVRDLSTPQHMPV